MRVRNMSVCNWNYGTSRNVNSNGLSWLSCDRDSYLRGPVEIQNESKERARHDDVLGIPGVVGADA